jgi:putative flippase GtrA
LTLQVSAHWERLPRFLRNALISFPTFVCDLVLLVFLVRYVHLGYLPATVVAFLTANVASYILARTLVFPESRRGLRAGFVYFLAIAAFSTLMLTPLMWVLVGVFHFYYVVSRILAASIVGVGGYLLNLLFNFRVAGIAPEEHGRASDRKCVP